MPRNLLLSQLQAVEEKAARPLRFFLWDHLGLLMNKLKHSH